LYRLYGVVGDTTLRIWKDGYDSALHAIAVDANSTLDVELSLAVVPRPDISGTYELTIVAASSCGSGFGSGNLPDEARVRTYTARLSQEGTRVRVALSGAIFKFAQHMFSGRVESKEVFFDLYWADGDDPPVVEYVPSLNLLSIDGTAVVSATPDGFAGTLSGRIRTIATESVWDPPSASCKGPHQFILTKEK
jgi:hypothetical protein